MVQKRLISSGKYMEKDEWKDPDVLGDFFFECIENIENMGAYAIVDENDTPTCIDYILDHMSAQGKNKRIQTPVTIRMNRYSYKGRNPHLSTSWRDGDLVEISDAIDEFYLKNSLANPEVSHCTVILDDPDRGWITTNVNCLTKILNMNKNNSREIYGYNASKYFNKQSSKTIADKVTEIVNSGARCGLYDDTTYNGIDVYKKTSCMEAFMDAGVYHTRDVTSPGTFGYNINDYDLSLDCISDKPQPKTMPCIQKLIQSPSDHAYTQFIRKYSDSGTDRVIGNLYEILSRKYKFVRTTDYDTEESSALDYILNSGIDIVHFARTITRSDVSISSFMHDTLCIADDKTTPVSCFSKLLTKIRDKAYTKSDTEYTCVAIDTRSLSRHVIEEECYDNDGTPISCMSLLIDTMSKNTVFPGMLSRLFNGIIEISPLSDFMCSENYSGIPRIINCLDKMIGISTPQNMDVLVSNGVIMDRMECTDWNGSPITCIDKLFQRHEMWVHNHFRARELRYLDSYFKDGTDGKRKSEKDIAELRTLSGYYNINEDPGYVRVSREYDVGSLKVHSPSKTFERFKGALESQIRDYQDYKFGSEGKTRYAQELLRSITSEKSTKEIQIVPRIYKMADVYMPNLLNSKSDEDMLTIGINSLIEHMGNPTTLNMFECRDTDTGTTISCIQKQIDAVKKTMSRSSQHNISLGIDNVMTYKDLFKPGMCTQLKTGEKMTCIEYAYDQLHSKFTDDTYVTLVSRKDFNKIAGVEINTPTGKTTVLESVCKRSSIRKIADYLYNTKTLDTVTNGNPTFNGTALSIFGVKCACVNKPTPLDRRICLDAACFNSYVPPVTTRENEDGDDEDIPHWAPGFIGRPPYTESGVRDAMYPFIYHDSQDYFGISGVYDITYKPSEYRITNTERFNYDEAVKTLFGAIKRIEGTTLARFGDKKNIKIEEITLFPPGDGREDYDIQVVFTELGTGEHGEEKGWVEHYSAASILLRGGLLNRDDIRMRAIRYKNENDVVEKILTRGGGTGATTSNIKLIISNRPADFMRASTCQDWSSCMNLKDGAYNFALPFFMGTGGYIAYLASDEFSPNWLSRAIMIPVMRYKPEDKIDGIHDDADPNNTFRVNLVYGFSMYKPLLNEALQVVLRDRGYNAPGSFVTVRDSGEFIAGEQNVKLLREDVWMNNRKEAYRNCIEMVASRGEVILPNDTLATNEEECGMLLKTLRHGGVKINAIYDKGLISKRSFRRFGILSKWDTSYLDSVGTPLEVTNDKVNEIKRKISVDYLKPITVPSEEAQ